MVSRGVGVGVEGNGIQAVMAGSRPSWIIPWSPKEDEIQAGDRIKQVREAPSTCCS